MAIGATIAALPAAAYAITVAGKPYYYANGVYYAPQGGQYAVVAPPQGAVVSQPAALLLHCLRRQHTKSRLRWRVLRCGSERLPGDPAAESERP